jgi:hypothetical protein
MYIRKTVDEYNIEGYYYNCWEVTTCESSYKEARQRLREYRNNAPEYCYRIKKRRVRK